MKIEGGSTVITRALVIDCFAGGGGASLGIEEALGRSVDIAINHDPQAVAMHAANHPNTLHYTQDVWAVKPVDATKGRPVALAWFSPDCTHHSKARGGKPRSQGIRDLAWVVVEWARDVRPAVIMLENVEEFRDWGPLDENDQPIKARKGETFGEWRSALEALGYVVDLKLIRACDHGAPTIRRRLFMVARCDGETIRWPDATHGKGWGLEPYRTAAECIDFSLPCPSIFDRRKPLVDATCRRIAAGIVRYVIETPDPFIVNLTHGGRLESIREPFNTITGANRGEKAVVVPSLVGVGGRAGQSGPRGVDDPYDRADNHFGEVRAFLTSYYGNERDGQGVNDLVTVDIHGQPYAIADIGMRMLGPRELFRAQGFSDGYIIDPLYNGKPMTKTAQIHACGNSVCPPAARALVEANVLGGSK